MRLKIRFKGRCFSVDRGQSVETFMSDDLKKYARQFWTVCVRVEHVKPQETKLYYFVDINKLKSYLKFKS